MTASHLLALDVGTQSVRALVFDPRGELVAGPRIPIEPYVSPQPGWAEQDPELYWGALGDALPAALVGGSRAGRRASRGVALTTQRGTSSDRRRGQPLRPAIVWLDQRRPSAPPPIGGAGRRARSGVARRRATRSPHFQADGRGELAPRQTSRRSGARTGQLPAPVRAS